MVITEKEKRLIVIIGADCDPDKVRVRGKNLRTYHGFYGWRGIREGIPEIKKRLSYIQNLFDSPFKLTWCVRSDLQIKEIYGNAGWCLREFSSFWKELEKGGDEIGWHLHLWRWNPRYEIWYQEIQDEEWIKGCILEGFRAFKEEWGKPPSSVRMGWIFHNNLTMEEISTLGLRVDFSAIPGLNKIRVKQKYIHDYADWRRTPTYPYHPSSLDYRIPLRRKSLPIWEIPCLPLCSNCLMWPYNFEALMSGKNSILITPIFPATITTFPFLFKRALRRWLKVNEFRRITFLATYFHPDELLSSKREFFIKNLLCIQKMARFHKREVHFLTASQSLDILDNLTEED